MEDEDSILPRKLHSAMEHLLDQMEEIVTQEAESSDEEEGKQFEYHGYQQNSI